MNTNQNWTINAPAGATYLSDFLTEIPANCLFNKKQTGCGATELAIRNSIPTIIAMPYVALVKNKTIYRKDDISVLGVYEGIQEQDIIDYAKSHSPLKIAVTYDSLPRTIRALESAGFNPYKDLFLLVDEWHVLFNSYSFRHTAIKNLLAEAAKFDRATYMTATPIEQEYVLEELKHLPICEINWPHLIEVNIRSRQTSKPAHYIVKECRKVLDSRLEHNLHIFVTTKYSRDVTLDEFVAATKKTLQEAVQYADEINSLSDTAREKTLSKIKYINEQYVRIEDNRLVVDRNFANMDIVNFKICRHIYRTYVNLTNELQRNGYTITRHSFSEIMEKIENKTNARVTFKELFDEYHRLKTTRPFFSLDNHEELCTRIALKYPLVKQAYDELGTAKVQALKYHVGNIRRELTKQVRLPSEYKIVKMIDTVFPKQMFISKSKAKSELQRIYDDLGIQKMAKAADLAKWYEIKETAPKINGRTTACVTIIRKRMIAK